MKNNPKEIFNFLKSLGENPEAGSSGVDILIKEKGLAIDYNNIESGSEKRGGIKSKYRLDKKQKLKDKNIKLINIFDYQYIRNKEIILSRLKNQLGKSDVKIFARNCRAREVSKKEKDSFLKDNHIQGTCGSSLDFGLIHDGELVCIMTFGKLRASLGNRSKEGGFELLRFCSKINTNVVGGASKLLTFFEKEYKPKSILSYADRCWSEGDIYIKMGFTLKNISRPNYWYFKDRNVYHRFNFAKHKLASKLDSFNPEKTEWENMQYNGWDRFWDCGSLAFTKFLPS